MEETIVECVLTEDSPGICSVDGVIWWSKEVNMWYGYHWSLGQMPKPISLTHGAEASWCLGSEISIDEGGDHDNCQE